MRVASRRRQDVTLEVTPTGEVELGGHRLFQGDRDDLMAAFAELVESGRTHTVVTPNVDHCVRLEDDPEFRRAYEESSLRTVDGAPVVALGRMLGAPALHRLTGADLFPDVAAAAPARGWTIAVTGGRPGVSEVAARALRKAYGAKVVSVDFGEISESDDEQTKRVIAELADVRAHVVFVCLGSPKQEVWLSRWRAELPPAVYVGAGAAVDFVAGTRSRAPQLVQRLGLEWVFRLLQEPRRLARRYLVRGPRFLVIAVRSLRARAR